MSAVRAAVAGLALLMAAACSAPAPPRAQEAVPVCPQSQGPPGPETATTIDVVEQAYFCILDAYYGGPALDARTLLTAGFAALTRELGREGRDLPGAVMPALTGDRKGDWAAFESTFRKLADQVPGLRERLAAAALDAVVAALGDDHARWTHG
ncbi:MAG: peptidase, partial [Nonomuraea sp.]|nr:peptidase [Nonomuraea sp.]